MAPSTASSPGSSRHRLAAAGLLLPLLLPPLAGCASLPEPKAQPTGEPLSVREKTVHYTYQTKEKVGEVEHKDSTGRSIGKSDVYANRTHHGSYQVWSGFQGNQPVSDDDFYRIAKDERASAEIKSSREFGVTLNRVGLGVLAAGVASAAAGFALRSSDGSNTAPNILMYGGVFMVPVGGILAYLGAAKSGAEHPLDQGRAEQAASRYNSTLDDVGTTAVTSATVKRR
ncbi:MAG: hypothetical protein JNL38_23725 [Myxococcales bacterium]|nr:hypothetical protein [Myxococcales bacterium]